MWSISVAMLTERGKKSSFTLAQCLQAIVLTGILVFGVSSDVLAEKPQTIPALQEWQDASGSFNFVASGRIVIDSNFASQLSNTAQVFQDDVRELKAATLTIVNGNSSSLRAGDIFLSLSATDAEFGDEGYSLDISDRVVINARKDNGVFYGTRTMLQLLKQSSTIAAGAARDFPRYPLRALHVDNGRKFVTTKWLKDHIKELAYLKMNLFHWHLSDWNNFRLESSTHPEVVAAEHYSKAEVQEMLALAAKYRVIIMPEFEMPGHMGWALSKHPELRVVDSSGQVHNDILDLTKPGSYTLVSDMLNEWLPLFPGPYFHLGTDESIVDYSKFPHYEAYAKANFGATANAKDVYFYFINWANDIVRSHGKTTWAWDDSKTGGSVFSLNKNIILDSWTNAAQRELSEGFQLINCAQSSLYYVWYTDWEPMQSQLYEQWAPHQWSYGNQGPLKPFQSGLLGAKLALWFDKNQTEEYSMSWGMMNSMRTVAQHTWASPKIAPLYPEFKALSTRLGRAPGTTFPITLPPLAKPNGPYSSALGSSVAFSSAGTLARNGNITKYKWDFGDGGTSTEANPVYTYRREGSFKALLVVTDSNGMTAGNEANVTVGSGIPRVDAGADQTVVSGATVTLTGAASDNDGGTLNYSWRQVSGPMISIRNSGSTTATFTAPVVATDSDLEFDLVVRDAGGLTAQDRVVIRVLKSSAGNAPVVNAGNDQTVASAANVSLRGSASDVDGGALTYSWRQLGGIAVTLNNANQANANFTAPTVSTDSRLEFELSVRDAQGLSAQDRVIINVQKMNTGSAPVVNAGTDQLVDMGAWVTLTGSASDVDGGNLSYAWRQISGPGVTLETPGMASARFRAPTVSADVDLVFELIVADTTGLTGSDRVSVRAQKIIGSAPVANAGNDQTVSIGSTVTLHGSATDIDGGALTYAWVQTIGPNLILSGNNTADIQFTAPSVAIDTVYTFQLTVRDSSGLFDRDEVGVTVKANANADSGGRDNDDNSGGGSINVMMLLLLSALGLLKRQRQ